MPGLESFTLLGPIAGVLTSVLWTLTSILFSQAGRRIGATVVNATRILLAIVVLGLIHRFFISDAGLWFPPLRGGQVALLALSGVVGLTIGDQCLFVAFVEIGPRLSNLLMTSAPLFAALLAWIALGETLSIVAWLGVMVTIAGVGWVILERPRLIDTAPARPRTRGIVLAVVGGFCQAAGLMLSKAGMGHGWLDPAEHLDPQAATLVRMVFAGLGILPALAFLRARRHVRERATPRAPTAAGVRRTGFLLTVMGTVVGPVLGVWMSLIAADATSVGIAQTLLSLTPIFILPYAAFVEREHVSRRAVLGALIAVVGVAILFGQA